MVQRPRANGPLRYFAAREGRPTIGAPSPAFGNTTLNPEGHVDGARADNIVFHRPSQLRCSSCAGLVPINSSPPSTACCLSM
jgi:hypothetical protein